MSVRVWIVLYCLITIGMAACVECICVWGLISIDAITPHFYTGRRKESYSTPFRLMKMPFPIWTSAVELQPVYHFLFIMGPERVMYSQPARQSVVQTKWFGLAGSRRADNGSTVQLKCLWCQWLCQQPRVADPKWRRAECPAGACHGLNRPVLIHFFLGGGSFSPRAHSRAGRFKAVRPLFWLICWHFVCFKGAKRQWGKRGRTVGQVQIESAGLPLCPLVPWAPVAQKWSRDVLIHKRQGSSFCLYGRRKAN